MTDRPDDLIREAREHIASYNYSPTGVLGEVLAAKENTTP